MKTSLLTLAISVFYCTLFAQNENPYAQFGYQAAIMPEQSRPKMEHQVDRLYIINQDSTDAVAIVALDAVNRNITIYDKNRQVLKVDTLTNYTLARWISPDPYGQFSSPYLGMGNVPNVAVDADGGYIYITTKDFKKLARLTKSLNRYYQTAQGKEMIDKYINDPNTHLNLTISDLRLEPITKFAMDGSATSYDAGRTATGTSKVKNDTYGYKAGDREAQITFNAFDVHPGSRKMSEVIGHEIKVHADFQFGPFGKHFGSKWEHRLAGSDVLIGNNWKNLPPSQARDLAKQLSQVPDSQIRNQLITIGISMGTNIIRQLAFQPAMKLTPRYIRTPLF